MTVAELIAQLQQYPAHMPVLVEGYEGGYNDVTPSRLSVQEIQRDVNPEEEWYYGPHDYPEDPTAVPTVTSLILRRDATRGILPNPKD